MTEKLAERLKTLLILFGYKAWLELNNSSPPRYIIRYVKGTTTGKLGCNDLLTDFGKLIEPNE
jgi:hypothetical protein